jgi:uncharacterized membrane protein YGL010W
MTTDRLPALTALFDDYSRAHRHPLNRVCHKVAIPLIVLTTVAMVDWIPLGEVGGVRLTAAMPAVLLCAAWYVRMDRRLGPLVSLLFAACIPLGRLLPLPAVLLVSAAAWVVQFIGHFVYEKKQPSFFTNLVHALVGPIYFMDSLWRKSASERSVQ